MVGVWSQLTCQNTIRRLYCTGLQDEPGVEELPLASLVPLEPLFWAPKQNPAFSHFLRWPI